MLFAVLRRLSRLQVVYCLMNRMARISVPMRAIRTVTTMAHAPREASSESKAAGHGKGSTGGQTHFQCDGRERL